MPSAISNEIFAAFHPALSDSANYIAARGGDQLCFRRTVAWSFAVSYGFAFASLLTLPLMPDQKADAQRRMREWPHATCYAVCTLLLVGLSMGYSLTINFLSLTPLACLPFVGGEGCGAQRHVRVVVQRDSVLIIIKLVSNLTTARAEREARAAQMLGNYL